MIQSRPHFAAVALSLATAMAISFPRLALAGETHLTTAKSVVEPAAEKPLCDRLWELPTIYKNKNSSFLNEFRFVGRAHFDVFSIDSDVGTEQDWIVRRIRAGIKARLFQHLELHVELDLNAQNPRPLYSRLTDAYLAWTFSEAARVAVGKQSVKFTLDGANSSNELLTIDRNNLANNLWFTTEYISGVSFSGKSGPWQYNVGYFSGGTDTKEFGNFDEGHFALMNLGYDFGKLLGVKKALVRADYVYNDRNLKSNATRPFENIGALVFQLDNTRWGLSAELAGGTGYGTQSDLWGATIMPWYHITKQIQLVVRYNYVESEDPRGVRLARYDSFVSGQRGDEYHEIYGGLNYYLCGHRLKVQTGVSYVSLDDTSVKDGEYHAWQWTSGLRLSF